MQLALLDSVLSMINIMDVMQKFLMSYCLHGNFLMCYMHIIMIY